MDTSFTLRALFNPDRADRGTIAVRPASGPAMLLFVLLVACALLAPLRAQAAADPGAGRIVSIDSGAAPAFVNILRLGRNGYLRAGTGATIFAGDTVKTGDGVRAQIELSDQSQINLAPKSSIQMKGYLLEPAAAKRTYVLKTLKGAVRFIISKTFKSVGKGSASPWRNSDVFVETGTAIAGIKGTDFVVTSMSEGAGSAPVVEIAVFEGSVQVRSMSLSIRQAVTLLANQVSTVQRRSPPQQPTALSPQRRNALQNSTTSTKPRQPQGAPTTPVIPEASEITYTEKDLAKDLAAGMPIAEAIDLASTAGLSVEQIITTATDAGVDPYALVSTAVTEGFSVETVVTTAIQNGAPINEVFAGAATAGGETTAIIDGAKGAGVSPENAATTITNVDAATPGTVPPPADPPVDTVVPADPVSVSGGGGETPSTLPASPSAP